MIDTFVQKPKIVNTKSISCDGGGGASGHPNVYLYINDNNEVTCPYCSQKFIFNAPKSPTPTH